MVGAALEWRAMKRWEVAIRRMPAPTKATAKWLMRVVDPAVVAVYRLRTGERHPLPPFRLRARVGVRGQNIRGFLESGREVATTISATVEELARPLDSFQRVLDFGCGNGRVLSHLALASEETEFHGSDVDEEAIAWASRHFPRIHFGVNRYAPPMELPDGHFDLIYSISIFTHLNEHSQDAWLRELDRLLSPGGIALLTTNGDHVLDWFRHSPGAVESTHDMSGRLARRGSLDVERFIFEPYRRSAWNQSDFIGVEDSYGLTFHSEGYVRDCWSDIFDVERHLPAAINAGQDLVVLSKRAGGEPESSLASADLRQGDPRR